MTIKVTFICHGNICRSPMVEAVFQELVNQEGLEQHFLIDSCGTSDYHTGETAHAGTRKTLRDHGIQYSGSARQIKGRDLDEADYLVALDAHNLADVKKLGPVKGEVKLLMDYVEGMEGESVPDPYYSGKFEAVYQMALMGAKGLLRQIREKEGI